MTRDNLPIYLNLPIDASIANFSVNYADIICLNTTKINSAYNLFKIIESVAPNVKQSHDFSNETKAVEAVISTLTENTTAIEQQNETVDLNEKYKNTIPEPNYTKPVTSIANTEVNEIEISKTNPSHTSDSKKIIETNDQVRKTYELYDKMFKDGTFGATTVPEAPAIDSNSSELEIPKIKTIEESLDAKATFEMYEKMFADGTFDENVKTSESEKTNESIEEKSEARATFEMYEKMFADGTFDENVKTPESEKTNESVEEKSEARATFEMYEKMFADGTFNENVKTSKSVEEKLDDNVNLEQFEKISSNDVIASTFIDKQTTEDIPKFQNIFEMIPNPLDQIPNNDLKTEEKVEPKETFEQLEKIFNEGKFENLENFKSAEFPKEILAEDAATTALEKINNFFINSNTVQQPNETIKTNFWSAYNLADKNENHSFFLKYDTENQILIETNEEHIDNIFKLKKLADNTYQFEMIESDVNHPFFAKNISLVLDLCEILNTRHGSHTRVKTIRTGKLVKEDTLWVVKDKAKGMYQ